MKKYIPLFLCILLLASCTGASEKRSRVLKVYNWADYIDEEVLAEFPAWYKEQTGEDIRIIYQVFDINEIMLTKIERGQEDFDLVCPSEYIIERMLKKDLLVPINRNFGKTPDGSGFGAFLSAFLSHDSADWKSCTGNPFRAGPGICRIFWGMVCRFTKISNVMP